MIFSKTIYKISSGNNVSIFATSANSFELFTFNSGVQKFNLSFGLPTKCVQIGEKKSYHNITKLTKDYICVCYNDNMTVTYDE